MLCCRIGGECCTDPILCYVLCECHNCHLSYRVPIYVICGNSRRLVLCRCRCCAGRALKNKKRVLED